MNEQIKISVVIPVYNAEKYLPECLDSVINQTLREIEIICVDDGSTDNSLQILREFERHDPRIKVITQRHQYAGVARNNGMQYTKGEYLLFLDADDFFAPAMLEKLYNKALEDDSDIVICDAKIYDNGKYLDTILVDSKNIPAGTFSCYDSQFADCIFQSLLGMPWNKMLKASFIKELGLCFSATLHHNDAAFSMGAMVFAHKISYLPESLISWRWVRDSLSHLPKISDSVYRSVMDLYAYISKSENYARVEHSFINFVVEYACRFYNYSQTEALKVLAVANIKAFYQEFDIGKYPDEYFYKQNDWKQFKKLAKWQLLPTAI